MKMRVFALLVGLCLIGLATGCYHTVEGRAKLGMPFVKDRFESRYERPAEQVFKAAKDVLAFNGTLTSENTIAKTLMAKVDTNTIWVKVDEVEPNITRVVVQARSKGGFSNQDLASEIDKQIALQLR
jgi:hypothetical protein